MRERVPLSRLGDQIQYPLGVLSELIGNFRFIPVLPLGWKVITLFQYLDDLIAGCGAEQDGEEEWLWFTTSIMSAFISASLIRSWKSSSLLLRKQKCAMNFAKRFLVTSLFFSSFN
jgi:hypothetical protein